jgi:hypothetical protein
MFLVKWFDWDDLLENRDLGCVVLKGWPDSKYLFK